MSYRQIADGQRDALVATAFVYPNWFGDTDPLPITARVVALAIRDKWVSLGTDIFQDAGLKSLIYSYDIFGNESDFIASEWARFNTRFDDALAAGDEILSNRDAWSFWQAVVKGAMQLDVFDNYQVRVDGQAFIESVKWAWTTAPQRIKEAVKDAVTPIIDLGIDLLHPLVPLFIVGGIFVAVIVYKDLT